MEVLMQLQQLRSVDVDMGSSPGDAHNTASLYALMQGQLLIDTTPGCCGHLGYINGGYAPALADQMSPAGFETA